MLVALSMFEAPTSALAEPIDSSRRNAGEPIGDFDLWSSKRECWTVRHAEGALGFVAEAANCSKPLMAVYRGISSTNVTMEVRFKLSGGKMPSAGIAVRIVGPKDYFLIRTSVVDGRLSLIRVSDGVTEEIAGVDAEIEPDHWQSLKVVAKDERFIISLDDRWVLTAFDRHPRDNGRVGLWTEQSASTLFDRIDISPAVEVDDQRTGP